MNEDRVASRIFQLESKTLDREFENIVEESVNQLGLSRLSNEVKLLFKLYILHHHMKKKRTIGMEPYCLSYFDGRAQDGQRLADHSQSYKLVLLTSFNLVIPYLFNKCALFQELIDINISKRLKIPWLTIDNIVLSSRLISVINFLEFLRKGNYLTLQERIFNVVAGINDQSYFTSVMHNKIQMDILYRETIWKSIAEFLTTIIPFINMTKIKNNLVCLMGISKANRNTVARPEEISSYNTDWICPICTNQPFIPRSIGCKHIFCYYCLFSKYLADTSRGFECSSCRITVADESAVLRVKTFKSF